VETAPARASLLDIQVAWLDLLTRREEAEEQADDRPVCLNCGGSGKLVNNQECQPCEGTGRSKSPREIAIEEADVAIAENLSREIEKVDDIIGFIRFIESGLASSKAERDRQATRVSRFDQLLQQVKAGAKYAIEKLQRKRIDGSRGYLLVKGNGGLAPLIVQDETLLPPEVVKLEGWVRADIWARVVPILPIDDGKGWSLKPRGSDSLIRAKLAEACATCEGTGEVRVQHPSHMSTEALQAGATAEVKKCTACAGSGKAAVPGAYLADRGNHLEVKV